VRGREERHARGREERHGRGGRMVGESETYR
jgi:hypothetical protein